MYNGRTCQPTVDVHGLCGFPAFIPPLGTGMALRQRPDCVWSFRHPVVVSVESGSLFDIAQDVEIKLTHYRPIESIHFLFLPVYNAERSWTGLLHPPSAGCWTRSMARRIA